MASMPLRRHRCLTISIPGGFDDGCAPLLRLRRAAVPLLPYVTRHGFRFAVGLKSRLFDYTASMVYIDLGAGRSGRPTRSRSGTSLLRRAAALFRHSAAAVLEEDFCIISRASAPLARLPLLLVILLKITPPLMATFRRSVDLCLLLRFRR